jgi:hypothetical protein
MWSSVSVCRKRNLNMAILTLSIVDLTAKTTIHRVRERPQEALGKNLALFRVAKFSDAASGFFTKI